MIWQEKLSINEAWTCVLEHVEPNLLSVIIVITQKNTLWTLHAHMGDLYSSSHVGVASMIIQTKNQAKL